MTTNRGTGADNPPPYHSRPGVFKLQAQMIRRRFPIVHRPVAHELRILQILDRRDQKLDPSLFQRRRTACNAHGAQRKQQNTD